MTIYDKITLAIALAVGAKLFFDLARIVRHARKIRDQNLLVPDGKEGLGLVAQRVAHFRYRGIFLTLESYVVGYRYYENGLEVQGPNPPKCKV